MSALDFRLGILLVFHSLCVGLGKLSLSVCLGLAGKVVKQHRQNSKEEAYSRHNGNQSQEHNLGFFVLLEENLATLNIHRIHYIPRQTSYEALGTTMVTSAHLQTD